MTTNELLDYLDQATSPDPTTAAGADWHEYQDVFTFLAASAAGEVPLYANHGGASASSQVFLYSLTIPQKTSLGLEDIDDILSWNFGVDEVHTSISTHNGGRPIRKSVTLSGPLERVGSKILQRGSPLFYLRAVDHDRPSTDYIELDSVLSQALDVHRDGPPGEGRKAWMHYQRGVARDIVRGSTKPHFLTIEGRALSLFLKASRSRLIRVFDFLRTAPGKFTGWSGSTKGRTRMEPPAQIFARHHVQARGGEVEASFLRGFQVIDSGLSDQQAVDLVDAYW